MWAFLLAGLALLQLATSALGADCEGRGCTCMGVEFNTPLKRFQPAVACLYYNGKKAVFYPKVDEYGVLDIKSLNYTDVRASEDADGVTTNASSSMFLAVEGRVSQGQNQKLQWVEHAKPWVIGSSVAPFYTAIVHLTKGVIDRVQWDSSCSVCSSTDETACISDGSRVKCSALDPPLDACRDCYIPTSECTVAEQCIPRVFVAWVGTDSKGNPCTSAGKVISRFRASSVRAIYSGGSASGFTLTPLGGTPIPLGSATEVQDANATTGSPSPSPSPAANSSATP